MENFVKAAMKSDVPEGSGKTVEVGGKKIALFLAGGVYYAVDDTCKHLGGPIGEGFLEGERVTCPWHGWDYDLKTGQCVTNPRATLQTYPVKVEGEEIFVSV